MNIKGAIFDFDGTLFDSMHVWETIGNGYLESIGIRPREDLTEKFKKMTLTEAAEFYRENYGVKASVEEIVGDVNRVVGIQYRNEVMPKDGIPEFLEALRVSGASMCIATVTDRKMIESALARTGLRHYFTDIFSCETLGLGKDKPEIFELCTRAMGTPKESTVIFEDSFFAATTAKKAGFTVVGVYDKFEKATKELEKLADVYVRDTRELMGLIGG